MARAWKWGAGSLSAGAALVSIISSVRSLPADHVRWIGVRPIADTAWAIGDTIQLAITITDAHGGVVPGVRVGWTSTDSSVASVDSAGRLDRDADTSNADGIVQAAWTLGGRPGRQRLSLGVDGTPSIATSLAADAEPVAGNTRIVPGEPPSGEAGLELAEPVMVRVTDSTGAPLGDVPVSWDAGGGGTIVADGARTDSLGQARARWTLGPRAGSQRAYVQVGASRAVPRAALSATAVAGPAASLALVRSAVPRGIAARPLVPAVQLRVTDRHGNPVAVPWHPFCHHHYRTRPPTSARRSIASRRWCSARPGTSRPLQRGDHP